MRRKRSSTTISAIGERGSRRDHVGIAGGLAYRRACPSLCTKDRLLATMRHRHWPAAAARARVQTSRSAFRRWSPSTLRSQFSGNDRRLAAFYVGREIGRIAPALQSLARRLHSNLLSGLTDILPRAKADRVAEATAALIDGLYIRRALKDGVPDAATAIALVEDYLETKLGGRQTQ